ncbi:MAG: divergent PAP2 family protein [Anaerolineales bacterium]|jgi:acid phosphatase family membrane protein YuiD|uniref:divergent PAP2 family protein n=1 Tax=Candidatus Villigracilis vicinus TaxID=3140679 RepID=UPI003134AEF3|nr:divergent PAP2 family protein [Anaerolineales bacterium]MBK7449574.1 divergent PAP2 family protein [Anaerolineales bacterium]MBK9779192.1 divergent PAP2 family protein [Anaerolineales bacterium]
MNILDIFQNKVLIAVLAGWLLAQALKIPTEYLRSRRWLWTMFFAAGGMPSSHTALMVSGTLAVALYHGFDNPLFGVAVAVTMIIAHDAAGVRRQAGKHAERINVLFDELLKGHMWSENELKEVIGHTPLEVIGGIILGLLVAIGQWMIWP